MIKKNSIFVLLMFCCLPDIFSQQEKSTNDQDLFFESCRGNKEFRLSKGSCKDVIKTLRISLENDSLAIDTFKNEYEIINMPLYTIKWLWKSSEIDIINFFNMKENRYYYCRSKIFKYIGPTLLVN